MANKIEEIWAFVYRDIFHENDSLFRRVVPYAGTQIVILLWTALYTIPDITGKPKWILKYKTQPGKNQPVDPEILRHAIKVALFNGVVVSIPWLLVVSQLQEWRGCSCRPEDIPTIGRAAIDVLGFLVIEEIGFYYSHRLFHWGPLYRRFHKQHHEFTASMAIATTYCHPVEHVVANLAPLTLSSVVMGSHASITLLWYVAALSSTINNHSGYHLPLMPSPEAHDFHHFKFNVNYGSLGVLDWWHGTSKMFKEYPHFQRHQRLLSLTPIRERFPSVSRQKTQ